MNWLAVGAAGALVLYTAGCGSSGAPPSDAPAPQPAIDVPVGEHYVIYYVDASGLRRRDTRTQTDAVIANVTGDVRFKESRDKTKVAVAFGRGDSTVLAIVDTPTGSIADVHATAGTARYTFKWSRESQELGVGYRTEGAGATRGGIMIVGADGDVRDVGCSVSNRLVSWVANGRLAVGDGANYYIVNARGCGTVATIPLRGKQDVTFSPDGRKMLLRRAPQDQFSRQRAGNRLELYVADYTGANPRQATGYVHDAKHPRWSPDSRKIAFELVSQQYRNLTHVAVYDVARNQATFDAKQRTLGQPTDSDPHWSPNSAKIVHDRSYSRMGAGQSYATNQKVIKTLPPSGTTLSNSEEQILSEELAQADGVSGDPIGRTVGWSDDTHIVFSSTKWTRITNVETQQTYDLPPDILVLSVVSTETTY